MTPLFPSATAMPGGYADITPAELGQRPPGIRLVDVREPDEFVGELGHAPGALLVPLATIGEACAAWNKSEPLVLICRSGNRSSRAALLLANQCFLHLYNLRGGMMAYGAAGLPTER